VSYRELAVAEPLRPWAECVWLRTGGSGPDAFARIVPDGCMDLLFGERAGLVAVGPNTTAFLSPLEPGDAVLGVRLHPGAGAPVLGATGAALLDARVPARELFGDTGARLEEALRAVPDLGVRARRLAGFVAGRARAAARPDPLVRAAARRVGVAPVTDVAGDLGVSERHLRRLVSEQVGYGPKRLGRVLRLRAAIARVRAGAELAEAAFEAGYADQAHFTNECRALAGVAPGRFVRHA
jgi:AraC-like DNA-binding protein